jgi:integrase
LLRITESVYRCKIRPFTKTTDETSDNRLQQVFLPEVLVRELEEWRRSAPDDAFIFPNGNGNPINREGYRTRYLVPLAKKAGVPKLTFQILRRSVATHMQSLASPQDIAGMLRHTRPQTAAEHFVQIVPESVRQASERLAAAILTV